MDNPGLAFLKKMHDERVYEKVYGKNSTLYKEVLSMDLSKDETVPMTVYIPTSGYTQLSIERHYFLPKSISAINLYFLVYVLLRDRFISFIYSLYVSDFDSLTYLQRRWFENKPSFYKTYKQNFINSVGKNFMTSFKIIMKRIDFKINDDEEEVFKTVYQMTRHELIAEFQFFLGRPFENPKDSELGKEIIPSELKIDLNRDPDEWLNSIQLAKESDRLFNLGVAKTNRELDLEEVQIFGQERQNLISWMNGQHLIISLNPIKSIGPSMRLKKCNKIYFEIRPSKTVTLNDCLSKSLNPPNLSILPQRRVPPERQPMVLFTLQRASKRLQKNLPFPYSRNPNNPLKKICQKHKPSLRYFPENKRFH